MTVDISKIKPGDELLVRVYATGGIGDLVGVSDRRGGPYVLGVRTKQIASHVPKPLEVGDRVRRIPLDLDADGRPRVYTITAMDADGWVLLADRGPSSRVASSLSFIERADGAPGEVL